MIKIGNSIIINDDEKDFSDKVDTEGFCVLNCGLSLRSTVTASSIDDDGFIYCLQRGISTIYGNKIPPQEFRVSWNKKPDEIYPSLETVTLLLLCEVSPDLFPDLQF